MKKKLIIVFAVITVILLLIPVKKVYEDNGTADLTGRRLLEDINRRLPVFREKGGGRYPENEMLERTVQEAKGEKVNTHRR